MKKITSLLAVAVVGLGIHSASANLIVNGDFESGNTGFSSDYSYKTPPNTAGAQYYIGTNATQFNSGFTPLSGYGGSGNFYIGNGSDNTAQSPWFQTVLNPSVTLTTDVNNPTYYRFEAQIANIFPFNGGSPAPDLAFEISVNGGAYNKFTATPFLSPGSWNLVYADTYLTTAPTSLAFRLRNQSPELSGNDFAIDSVYFDLTSNAPSFPTYGILSAGDIANPSYVGPTGVPEPGQVAASLLLLGGIGGYVFLKRRKSAKTAVATA